MSPPHTRKTRVLVVEDDHATGNLLVRQLQATGFEPVLPIQTSVDEALNYVREERVDVVLLDLNLEDSDSTRTVLSIPDLVRQGVALVVVTMEDDAQILSAARRLGAHAITPKTGLTSSTLATVISEAIQTRDVTKSLFKTDESEGDNVTAVPIDETPARGYILDSHGRRVRPESDRTLATLTVGSWKYKFKESLWKWLKEWGPRVALVLGVGGAVEGRHHLPALGLGVDTHGEVTRHEFDLHVENEKERVKSLQSEIAEINSSLKVISTDIKHIFERLDEKKDK